MSATLPLSVPSFIHHVLCVCVCVCSPVAVLNRAFISTSLCLRSSNRDNLLINISRRGPSLTGGFLMRGDAAVRGEPTLENQIITSVHVVHL